MSHMSACLTRDIGFEPCGFLGAKLKTNKKTLRHPINPT